MMSASFGAKPLQFVHQLARKSLDAKGMHDRQTDGQFFSFIYI